VFGFVTLLCTLAYYLYILADTTTDVVVLTESSASFFIVVSNCYVLAGQLVVADSLSILLEEENIGEFR
jgi:hypothetical protein